MTDFTTDQLQRLLDQAASGPWEYHPGEAPDERYIGDWSNWDWCIGVEANNEGSSCSDDDLTLANEMSVNAKSLTGLLKGDHDE